MSFFRFLVLVFFLIPQSVFGCKYPPNHSWEWSPENLVKNSKDILIVQVFGKEQLDKGKFLYQANILRVLKGKLKKTEVVKITLNATPEPVDKADTFYLYKSTECETFGNLILKKQYIYFPNHEHPESIKPIDSIKDRAVENILEIIKKSRK